MRVFGQVGCDGAAFGLRFDQAEAWDFDLGPLLGQQANDGVAAQINRDDVVTADPIGAQALGVGAFAFAFDRVGHLSAAVVAGDMGFVRPTVGCERDRVVPICTFRQACDVEGKEDVDEIGKNDRRQSYSKDAFAGKKRVSFRFDKAQVSGGHAFCPSVRRLR